MAYYATYMPDETGEMQKVVINAGVGFVLPYYGETAPPGTLACDGSEISRATYSELFDVLGTKAGAGDGVSTFNLPDLRGMFIRGTGGNAAALGVQQGDAIREIYGTFREILYQNKDSLGNIGPTCSGAFTNDTSFYSDRAGVSLANQVTLSTEGDIIIFRASSDVPTAPENRPVNVALLWCIIYE